ncbi:hypothetical protein HA052_27330, partial [Chromobacterium haemolyticum]
GNDQLFAGWRGYDNVFEGGAGNDTLTGSYARDTYLFNLGDGQDVIIDKADAPTVNDAYRDELVFGVGIKE